MFNRHRTLSRIVLWLSFALTSALECSSAMAVELCVDSPATLTAALSQATLVNLPFTIKIVQGNYAMTSNLLYSFLAPITVEGGYTPSCASRVVDPGNTAIDIGAGHIFSWNQHAGSPRAEINIEGLAFRNSNQGVFFNSGTGSTAGSVKFRQVRFTQLELGQNQGSPLLVSAYSGSIFWENVLIDHIEAANSCSVEIYAFDHASVSISHLSADLAGGKDFCLRDQDDSSAVSIYNSVLWSSDVASGLPLPLFAGALGTDSSIALVNDIYSGQFTAAMAFVENQIIADPQWINPATGDYHLQSGSPAINSGTLFAPGGEPPGDIEGHTRVIGSRPDRGAYESSVTDQSAILVTNTNDAGVGSLREAITIANSTLSPKLIKFDIRNQANVPLCPAVIALNSVLPAINGRMTIDGYTQPGSIRNTSAGAFNANLCVVLKPASGSLSYGFTVPADSFGSLVLRGFGLGGFSQPVRVLGGQNSQITGSQFGGTANGISLPGASFSAIIFGTSASGDILVGGNNPGDRNVIGGAASNGIDSQTSATNGFTTCQLVNNLIGLAPNGIDALPNSFGINATGSGCQIVGNRIAGNSIINLWIQGSQTVAQQNLIGFNIQNNGFFTNTTGINVTGSGNIIGAGGNGGSISANIVRYNIAGGVVVKGDAAVGNSVNANRIYDNGNNSDGMDIDLWPTSGVAGPTLNDAADLDSGANDLQNFPVPKSLVYTATGTIDRPATLTAQLVANPGTYRVDVYFSNAINLLGKRGHAETILTHFTVQVPASGRLGFPASILVPNQNAGGAISMTATSISGSTSEVGSAMSTDSIFSDGIE